MVVTILTTDLNSQVLISGVQTSVILSGQGMKQRRKVEVLIDVSGSHIHLSGSLKTSMFNHIKPNFEHFMHPL